MESAAGTPGAAAGRPSRAPSRSGNSARGSEMAGPLAAEPESVDTLRSHRRKVYQPSARGRTLLSRAAARPSKWPGRIESVLKARIFSLVFSSSSVSSHGTNPDRGVRLLYNEAGDPWRACAPVSISYKTTPHAQTSAAVFGALARRADCREGNHRSRLILGSPQWSTFHRSASRISGAAYALVGSQGCGKAKKKTHNRPKAFLRRPLGWVAGVEIGEITVAVVVQNQILWLEVAAGSEEDDRWPRRRTGVLGP